jgi:hypothetical protein
MITRGWRYGFSSGSCASIYDVRHSALIPQAMMAHSGVPVQYHSQILGTTVRLYGNRVLLVNLVDHTVLSKHHVLDTTRAK